MDKEEHSTWFEALKEKYHRSPMHRLMGLELTEVAEGAVTIEFSGREEIRNAVGDIHGGALSTVLDSSLMQAVRTTLREGDQLSTAEFKVNFVKPARGDHFRCEGRLIHTGRTLGVAEGKVFDGKGQIVAVALGTIFVRRGE